MSKIIKASQISGEYRMKAPKSLEISHQEPVAENIQEKPEELRSTKSKAVRQAQIEAAEILTQARKAGKKIIQEAKEEAEKIKELARESAYAEGYQAGFSAGEEEALKQQEKLLKQLAELIMKIKSQLEEKIDYLSGDVVKLAVKIAAKVVHAELEVNPQLINNIVHELLTDIANFDTVKVRIHPELLNYLLREELKNNLQQQIEFIPDSELEPGDCIVENRLGGRDGTIKNKLALLQSELLKGVGYREESGPE